MFNRLKTNKWEQSKFSAGQKGLTDGQAGVRALLSSSTIIITMASFKKYVLSKLLDIQWQNFVLKTEKI